MIRICCHEAQGFNGNSFSFLRGEPAMTFDMCHLFAFPKRIPISLSTDIRGTDMGIMRSQGNPPCVRSVAHTPHKRRSDG